MVEKLKAVTTAFPGSEAAIMRLYFRDTDFRNLCDDYCDAIDARERWRGFDTRFTEYGEIISELEQEIATILKAESEALDEGQEIVRSVDEQSDDQGNGT